MESLDFSKLKSYALVFLAGLTAASVFWVFVAGKNPSPSNPSGSSLEKVAGAETANKGAINVSTTVVDISGAVKNPGVFSLPTGSRLGQALEAAGGIEVEKADAQYVSKQLNLASEVRDGQKIYIPFTGEVVSSLSSSSAVFSSSLVSINNGSSSELDTLPGIGPATAAKIVSNRPYAALEELVSKKAVSQSVYEKIKTLITL